MKEKILLLGETGTGKTYTCVRIAEALAKLGKRTVIIDPEYGSIRELELLPDEVLQNIELRVCPTWPQFQAAVERTDSEFFLKVIDGLSEAFVLSKRYLTDKFIKLGSYIVSDKEFKIKDTDTFTLPWSNYPKVYDNVRDVVWSCMEQKPHVIMTMHPITGGTDARSDLLTDIYRRFDTIIRLETATGSDGGTYWRSFVLKHRGRGIPHGAVLRDHISALISLFERRAKS